MLVTLGSLGIGFVWGWLSALVIGRIPLNFSWRRISLIVSALIASSSLISALIANLTELFQIWPFLGAGALGLLLHLSILQALRLRINQSAES